MVVPVEPIRGFKCTYKDCYEVFDTEKGMKRHKKYSEEHDYCHKCDEDFEDFAAYCFHKILEPVIHNKACRICGDEFKSESGLKRHVELNHRIDQRLVCIGCKKSYSRPVLFIEHLEFGHCPVISATQFQGHIIHKHLISEYLKGDEKYERFQQKQAKFEATIDYEEEGGVDLGEEVFGGDEIEEVQFEAIKPEVNDEVPLSPAAIGDPFPPLPASSKSNTTKSDISSRLSKLSISGTDKSNTTKSDIASNLSKLSISSTDSGYSTVVGSPLTSPVEPAFGTSQASSWRDVSVKGSTVTTSTSQPKAWVGRGEKGSASKTLFPTAKPTPAPTEWSIAANNENQLAEQTGSGNIMNTRFWDPQSTDFNPERFYDAIAAKFYCPFVCEQSFVSRGDLCTHILQDHRIARMKCPSCLKYFNSATSLIGHCESRGAKCSINKAEDYGIFLDRLSGGFLGVKEIGRPDFKNNPTRLIANDKTGRMEKYQPVAIGYLQYVVTKPPDWKEPVKTTTIGGIPRECDDVW